MAFWNTSYGVSFRNTSHGVTFMNKGIKVTPCFYFLNKPTTFCTRFTASCCVGFCFRASSTCTK